MEATRFTEGMDMGRIAFAQLDSRGSKWKSRNVPVFIREQLWRPWYLTEQGQETQLFIIQPPGEHDEKVHFVRWVPPN